MQKIRETFDKKSLTMGVGTFIAEDKRVIRKRGGFFGMFAHIM